MSTPMRASGSRDFKVHQGSTGEMNRGEQGEEELGTDDELLIRNW